MNNVKTAPRVALSNCTNSSWTTSNPPDLHSLKRRVSTEYSCSKKRPKLGEQAVDYDHRKVQADDSLQGEPTRGGQRNYTTFGAIRAAQMRPRRNFHCASSKSQPLIYVDYTHINESLF